MSTPRQGLLPASFTPLLFVLKSLTTHAAHGFLLGDLSGAQKVQCQGAHEHDHAAP